MEQNDKELTKIVSESSLEQSKAETLVSNFSKYFAEAKQIASEGKGIIVDDENDNAGMQKAREARLKLKEIRVQSEKQRKELKEQSLREGRAIDGVANVLKALIIPVEEHLEKQEKYAENLKAEKRERKIQERLAKIAKYTEGDEQSDRSLVENLSDEAFDRYSKSLEQEYKDKLEAEKEAEEKRIAEEKARIEEEKRIRAENERLRKKAEAERKEREELEKRRLKAEAKIKEQKEQQERENKEREEAERKAKEKAEAEEKAKKEAEEKAQREKELAPDKTKLSVLASSLLELEIPSVKDRASRDLVNYVEDELKKLNSEIIDKIEKL